MNKIYIDTNIIDTRASFYFSAEIWNRIISIIDIDPSLVVTSNLTINEIRENKSAIKDIVGEDKFNKLSNITIADKWIKPPSRFGVARFGMSGFGDASGVEDPLYIFLVSKFDEEDALHIFSAIKAKCKYFLTFDKKTILNRVKNNLSKKQQEYLKIEFIGVEEFLLMQF